MAEPNITPDTAQRLARLDALAERLDAKFHIPGTRIRFGWDSLLGLIPGVGDLVTTGPAAYMMIEAWRMGARKRTVARMAANTGLDMIIGGIPGIGDAFDIFFKANKRNIALLESDIARNTRQIKETRHARA